MDIPSIVCHARWWLLLVGEGQEIIKLTNTKENISKKSQKKKRGGPVGVVARSKDTPHPRGRCRKNTSKKI